MVRMFVFMCMLFWLFFFNVLLRVSLLMVVYSECNDSKLISSYGNVMVINIYGLIECNYNK